MNEETQVTQSPLRAHWFFVAAASALVVNALAIYIDRWESPRLLEAGLLFDFAVLIPLLYLICYRAKGKQTVARAIALACLGIWAVGHVVPDSSHLLLQKLGFVRYVGLGVLVILELKLVVVIYRAVFNADSTTDSIASKSATESGAPQWVVRVLAWEASIWLRLWNLIRKFTGRS